jgi:hypothetical protein
MKEQIPRARHSKEAFFGIPSSGLRIRHEQPPKMKH